MVSCYLLPIQRENAFKDPCLATFFLSIGRMHWRGIIRVISYPDTWWCLATFFLSKGRMHWINLENNNIAGFDKSVFSNPGSVTTLAIGDNPLHCDCRLSWVASMVKRQDMMENTDAQCMTPPHLQDRYLQHVPHYSLVCTGIIIIIQSVITWHCIP